MQKHDLHTEFPEYNDRIHELKIGDRHFRKLFDEYHLVDHKIHSLEYSEKFTDQELTELRLERVQLKDSLLRIIEGKKVI